MKHFLNSMFKVQSSKFEVLPRFLSPSLLPLFSASALLLSAGLQAAGPSVASTDAELRLWAGSYRDLTYGANVTSGFQTPAKALGPATGNLYDIVSLGEGGRITLEFAGGMADGPGWDFAVFENAFGGNFLELAFVEVSSDGQNWLRFPSRSETVSPVGAYGTLDPALLDGFAGLHFVGQGTEFDLASLRGLPGSNLLDFNRIRYVRLVDIIGDGREHDSSGRPIYDPYVTQGSAGFDLEAAGARYPSPPEKLASTPTAVAGHLGLSWNGLAGARYRIETSPDLITWTLLRTVDTATDGPVQSDIPLGTDTKLFARIGREK